MVVEITANECSVLRPVVERIGCTMNTDKTTTVADEFKKGGLLVHGHREFPGRIKHDRIVSVECVGGQHRSISGDVYVERVMLPSDSRQYFFR